MSLFGSKVSGLMGSMKIDREIADLESKKQTLIRSVQNEIDSLQAKLTSAFNEIGSAVYASNQAGNFSIEQFEERFSDVTKIKETIAEKEAKISEISNRYDEEITLLKNLNPSAPDQVAATAAAASETAGHCGSCGTEYRSEDVFCRNCGTKLAK